MTTNVNYIQAAIEQATGERLNLEEVVELLLEENMITSKQAKRLIMRDYRDYYDPVDDSVSEFDDFYTEGELNLEEEN